MRVLLIDPNVSGDYPGASQPHLGLAYLGAILLQKSVDLEIFDMRLGYTLRDLESRIRQYRPDLVGITAFSIHFDFTRRLIHFIKRMGSFKIVIGGPHVSALRSYVLRSVEADFAVKGEGEYTLLELCDLIEHRNNIFNDIKGLIWRNGNQVVENEDRPYITNLDDIPFPAFDKFELPKYIFHKERRLPITTSRGCPYGCIYCSVRLSMGRAFRPRSPKNVVQEILHWYNKGWKEFDFQDDCFSFDLARAKKICDMIVESGMRIKWYLGNGIRVDKIDRELLEKMKSAGCMFVCFGVESGNNQVLKAIRKGITVEKARGTFEMTREAGLVTGANFIVGHPTETFNKALETLDFARSIPVDLVNFYTLVPYPGTELYSYVEEHGNWLQPKETYLETATTRFKKPIFETTEFPASEREKVLRRGQSLSRKIWLQHLFGRFVGYFLWVIARYRVIELLGRRMVLGQKLGRRLFNLIKRW